jgi:antirestriction protein ArdC
VRISEAEAAFLHIIGTSRLLTVLKNDARAIVSAASHASKASDFLLAFAQSAALTGKAA